MADEALAERVARLTGHYRTIADTAMAGIPILNPRLAVAATAFRAHGGQAFGIIVTPWFMNLVAIDRPDGEVFAPARTGDSVGFALPAGRVEFIAGAIEGFGRVDACSLFSPMDEFADMDAAMEVATIALAELFADTAEAATEPARSEPAPAQPALSRRGFLTGRKQAEARP